MRILRASRTRVQLALWLAVTVVAALVVGVFAWVSPGLAAVAPQSSDGGVWVTNPGTFQVGHLNTVSEVLDSGLVASQRSDFDVAQSGTNIALVQGGASPSLAVVSAQTTTMGQTESLPAHYGVALGGTSLVVVDTAKGTVWASVMGSGQGYQGTAGTPALTKLGSGTQATVSTEGTVFVVSPAKGTVTTLKPQGASFTVSSTQTLSGVSNKDTVQISAVGQTPVVLDMSTSQLLVPGHDPQSVPDGSKAAIQQPGEASDKVLVETPQALLQLPVGGGNVTTLKAGASGGSTAPVYLAGCSYAVWSGTAKYLLSCQGQPRPQVQTISGVSGDQLRFRVNGSAIALNDLSTGGLWVVDKSLTKVDASQWDTVAPPPPQKNDNAKQQSELLQSVGMQNGNDKADANKPPNAVDDTFGVRAGRTTVLPVLANDSDPGGNVLTANVGDPNTRLGVVQQVQGGKELEIAVAAGSTGTAVFTYTAFDGRLSSNAQVTLTVVPDGMKNPPVQIQIPTVPVAAGATIGFDILPDWMSPDGDALYLVSAAEAGADGVRTTPDGEVTFSAVGGSLGEKTVRVVVSDGVEQVTGEMVFNIVAKDAAKPIANGTFVLGLVGQTLTVQPMVNDLSPSGSPLQLTSAGPVANAQVNANAAAGTFTFIAASPGSYFVPYTITDGLNEAKGTVRIDVEAATASKAPIAVPDVAYLPRGGSTLVDVLANDTDPTGGVLVLQNVVNPPDSGISAAIVNHQILRVTDQPGATGPVNLTYTVYGGGGSATTQVTVLPVPPSMTAPVAQPDTVTVRAGDIVTIPVLDNDYAPSGITLSVTQQLAHPLSDPNAGTLFVSQNQLRFKAGSTPMTVTAAYTAMGSNGQSSSAPVTIQILPGNPQNPQPPAPATVVARAISGTPQTTTRIAIPLQGIDPNGASVQLMGAASNPTMGQATYGASWVDYQPFPNEVGTDTFSYTVTDSIGQSATGTVQVGVAPAPSPAPAPIAVPDSVTLRPDRQVSVNVLGNDMDPDGYALSLANNLTVTKGVEASVAGTAPNQTVLVKTPSEQGTYLITYTVVNAAGQSSIGSLGVTVKKDAPLNPLVVNDDVVAPAQVVGRTSVTVDVLGNDADPNGTVSDLSVKVDDPQAKVDGGKVTIPVTAELQIITYTDTSPDNLSGDAFIIVPGSGEHKNKNTISVNQTFATHITPLTVQAGQPLTVDVTKDVTAPNSAPFSVDASSVQAGHSQGQPKLQNATTVIYTSVPDYSGPDALGMTVTSGQARAVISIPITVTPPKTAKPVPPVFAGTTLNLGAGDPTTNFDLAAVTTDPDPTMLSKLTYALQGGIPSGFTGGLRGSTLSVAANASTAKGTTASIRVAVSDGQNSPVVGSVQLVVGPSHQPLPSVPPGIMQVTTNMNTPVNVNVLQGALDPLGKGLHLVDATVTDSTPQGTARVNGKQLTVTPNNGFIGTVDVAVRIGDATNDPARYATRQVAVTVIGPPAQPGTPSVTSVGDGTVILTWAAPPTDNGSPITGYIVKGSDGSTTNCLVTTCTINNLVNGINYTFTIIAINKVGDSVSSAVSGSAMPNVAPNAVTTITATTPTSIGSGQVTVQWSPATVPNNGTAITGYYVVNGTTGQKVTVAAGTTSYTFSGLTNGTTYYFYVIAVNAAGNSGNSQQVSASPAGPPPAPSVSASGAATTVSFKYSATQTNGRSLASVQYQVDGGGWTTAGLSGTVTVGNGYNQSHSINVRAVDTDGRTGASASASGTSSNPIPSVTVGKGAQATSTSCWTGPCANINVTITGGRTNTAYVINYWTDCAGGNFSLCANGNPNPSNSSYVSDQVTTDGNGNLSHDAHPFGYPGANVWVTVTGGGLSQPVRSNTVAW